MSDPDAVKGDSRPADVVRAVTEAADDGRWNEVFAMILHAELPRWRRTLMSALRHWERAPEGQAILRQWNAITAAELETLHDRELFARWMAASSVQARTRLAFSPAEAPPAPRVRRVILGEIFESKELAHVLYREIAHPGGRGALRVASLRRTGSGWKAEIDYDLLGSHGFHAGPPPA